MDKRGESIWKKYYQVQFVLRSEEIRNKKTENKKREKETEMEMEMEKSG
jgi:hypothetical protein